MARAPRKVAEPEPASDPAEAADGTGEPDAEDQPQDKPVLVEYQIRRMSDGSVEARVISAPRAEALALHGVAIPAGYELLASKTRVLDDA